MFKEKDNEFIAWYPPNLNEEEVTSVWKPKKSAYYVHIPFCTAICDYCGFSVEHAKGSNIKEYLNHLEKEIKIYSNLRLLSGHKFICGHFGGGTPSVLSAEEFTSIKRLIDNEFDMAEEMELTVEVNPISFTQEKALAYFETGVNRISFGIQSFNNKILKIIGRPHKDDDIHETLNIINSIGWSNFSIDLIYGVPGQTLEELENDLYSAINTNASHISCFRLEIIPFTALKLKEVVGMLPKRKSVEELNEMDDLVSHILTQYGYIHYGAFNFAKPGKESIHNEIAFVAPQGEYVGFGNSSYSYINNHVYCNYAELYKYQNEIQAQKLPIAYAKKLSAREAMSRYFVLGIKFFKVQRDPFIEAFGIEPEFVFGDTLERLAEKNMLLRDGNQYVLTSQGRYFVNNVCKEFYVDSAKGVNQYIQFTPTLTANQIDFYMNKLKKNDEYETGTTC